MDVENLKLVELADNLSYKQTKRHLNNAEKIILKQILMGIKYYNIRCPKEEGGEYNNDYIRNELIPKLWDHLSEVFGKRIGQKNIKNELKKLQSQNQESRLIALIREIINRHIKIKGDTVVNRSILGKTKKIYCLDSEGTSQNAVRLNTLSAYSTQLTINGQQYNTSPDAEEQKFEDDASEQIQARFHDHSYQVVKTDRPGSTNSTYSWRISMRLSKAGLPLLIAAGVFGTWYGFYWLANWYGTKNYLEGNLPQAQSAYNWALKLDPLDFGSREAHYNLGGVYEDQQNYSQAQAQYQKAMELGLIPAYNSQARLYILNGKYDAAVALLRIALPLAKNENEHMKYSVLKNRGWARLEQGRLEEAHQDLTEAIALKSDRSPAYCLLAQVLERQGENTQALIQWGNCLDYAYQPQAPEEDKWINLAQQRLQAEEGNQ